jgi:hypothetical protein
MRTYLTFSADALIRLFRNLEHGSSTLIAVPIK